MRIGEDALGRPVEIEFAVRLPQHAGEPADFGFLQLRPLVMSREGEDIQHGRRRAVALGLPELAGAGARTRRGPARRHRG